MARLADVTIKAIYASTDSEGGALAAVDTGLRTPSCSCRTRVQGEPASRYPGRHPRVRGAIAVNL